MVAILRFAPPNENVAQMIVLHAQRGEVVQQTDMNTFKSHPAWSPDAKEVAFYSTPYEASASYPHPFDREKIPDIKGYAVCVLNIQTGAVRTVGPPGYGITEERLFPPCWSPDGSKIAFEATYQRMWGPGWKERRALPERRIWPSIHIVNADGTGLERISLPGCYDTCPVWSPDGSKIAFVSRRAKPDGSGIYIMNPEGAAQQKIPGTTAAAERILWSPDGKWIAFTSYELAPGKSRRYKSLFIVTPSGDQLIPVCPEIPVDDSTPIRWATLP